MLLSILVLFPKNQTKLDFELLNILRVINEFSFDSDSVESVKEMLILQEDTSCTNYPNFLEPPPLRELPSVTMSALGEQVSRLLQGFLKCSAAQLARAVYPGRRRISIKDQSALDRTLDAVCAAGIRYSGMSRPGADRLACI